MKVITFQDIAKLNVQPSLCFDWAESMIRHKKKALLPPKISLKPVDGVFCNVMPSMIPGTGNSNWADCPKTKIEFGQDTICGEEQKQETPDVVCRETESRVFGQPVGG